MSRFYLRLTSNVSLCVSSCLCIHLSFSTRCEKCEKRKNVDEDNHKACAIHESVAHPLQSEQEREGVWRGVRGKKDWVRESHGPTVFFLLPGKINEMDEWEEEWCGTKGKGRSPRNLCDKTRAFYVPDCVCVCVRERVWVLIRGSGAEFLLN